MPVSRDRLSRPVDISSLLPDAQRRVSLIVDEPGLCRRVLCSQNATKKTGQCSGSAGRIARRGVRAQRTPLRHHRNLNRLPIDQENRTPVGTRSSQGRRSVLPSWYPRTPLRDITAIVRAIERRRAELRDQSTEASQQEPNASQPDNQLETETKVETPMPTVGTKVQPLPASQPCEIVDTKDDENVNDSHFITPQKKLLNSIDKVRQIWLEEHRKLERTPAARKVEREKKIRTLMSMR